MPPAAQRRRNEASAGFNQRRPPLIADTLAGQPWPGGLFGSGAGKARRKRITSQGCGRVAQRPIPPQAGHPRANAHPEARCRPGSPPVAAPHPERGLRWLNPVELFHDIVKRRVAKENLVRAQRRTGFSFARPRSTPSIKRPDQAHPSGRFRDSPRPDGYFFAPIASRKSMRYCWMPPKYSAWRLQAAAPM